MENLVIEKTEITPDVNFDYDRGLLSISGRSIPEDSYKFYLPIIEWLDQYLKEIPRKTIMEFRLEYFNTSSTYFILNLIKVLARLNFCGGEVQIKWYYNTSDDDMVDAARDLGKLGNFPLELVEL